MNFVLNMNDTVKPCILSNPLVSVVIPMYNAQIHIRDTITSVQNQIYQNWECIVIDDHSVDGSVQLVKEMCKTDNRIKLYIRPDSFPKGASACRNFGIACGQGEFFIFLDSDDIISDYCLIQRIQVFQNYPENDFLIFSMGSLTNQGVLTGDIINDDNNVFEKSDYLKKFFRYELPWTVTCPIWRKHALLKLKGFDESFPKMEDPDLHTRALLMRELNFRRMDEYLPDCYYRQGKPEKYLDSEFQQVVFLSLYKYFQKFYCQLKEANNLYVFKEDFRTYLFKVAKRIIRWNYSKKEFDKYVDLISKDKVLRFLKIQIIGIVLIMKAKSFICQMRSFFRLFCKFSWYII